MLLNKKSISNMLLSTSDLFKSNANYLSEVDSRFGDGDHGVTINKIANLIDNKIDSWKEETIKEFIENLGNDIMEIGGGSAGPLYGTLILGLADPLHDEDTIDATLLKKMFLSSQSAMFSITKARVGDKTMMDAFIPAVNAISNAPDNILEILFLASEAAQEGVKASEGFVSKFGRARSYGTETLGTPDVGAISTALFFKGFYTGILN